jgi:hypothetical protein
MGEIIFYFCVELPILLIGAIVGIFKKKEKDDRSYHDIHGNQAGGGWG